jgi:hypothetical protein
MIRINKKIEKGMKFQFTYDPNNDNDNVKDINYQNTSGYLNNKSIKWLTE